VSGGVAAASSAGRRLASGLIRAYQLTFSASAGRTCRHLPTCSDYADEAVQRHGVWPGAWMAAARICRCGPGGTSGLDFVCEAVPERSAWFLPWRYGRWRGTNSAPPGSA
jgi:putative membrane protein insertion efficiency factor